MPLPVTIADDSALSRKLIARSLPEEWKISITHATNGREALEAYRAGKAHLLLLDLNMPEINGYQVMETLRTDGLKAFIIVVSADIQPKAQERARALGAMAFVNKPVDAFKLNGVLRDFGLL
jgi:CheY-like chemotaxis protein